jgi:K+-sensing histidine kinase KdpD
MAEALVFSPLFSASLLSTFSLSPCLGLWISQIQSISLLFLGISQWVYDHREPAGIGTQTLPASPLLYLPMQTPKHQQGIIAIHLKNHQAIFLPEQQRLLDNFITQTALALERAKAH